MWCFIKCSQSSSSFQWLTGISWLHFLSCSVYQLGSSLTQSQHTKSAHVSNQCQSHRWSTSSTRAATVAPQYVPSESKMNSSRETTNSSTATSSPTNSSPELGVGSASAWTSSPSSWWQSQLSSACTSAAQKTTKFSWQWFCHTSCSCSRMSSGCWCPLVTLSSKWYPFRGVLSCLIYRLKMRDRRWKWSMVRSRGRRKEMSRLVMWNWDIGQILIWC